MDANPTEAKRRQFDRSNYHYESRHAKAEVAAYSGQHQLNGLHDVGIEREQRDDLRPRKHPTQMSHIRTENA